MRVKKVVDGDTLTVEHPNFASLPRKKPSNKTYNNLRLIGIDTPESVHPNKAKNVPEGRVASNFVKQYVRKGQLVLLRFDRELLDHYDRLLAYVYVDGVNLNELIMSEGMATPEPVAPNTTFAQRFLQLAREAYEAAKGFWQTLFAPVARQLGFQR